MSARRRAATSLAATGLVADVARILAVPGILVMPVKGALLQHWLYEDPSERPLTDVDLLVRPRDFERAVETLLKAGYRRSFGSGIGAQVMQTPFGLALDLHPRLFDRMRYRFATDEIFARSSKDESLFGARVQVPSALDVYAHLIGKAGSDHLDARASGRLDEIARMSTRLEASAKTTARHLAHCGMGRVSRYVLPLVQQSTADPFVLSVYDHLPADRLGRAIAFAADQALQGASPQSSFAALFAHLLNESVPRAVYSGSRALIRRRRRS